MIVINSNISGNNIVVRCGNICEIVYYTIFGNRKGKRRKKYENNINSKNMNSGRKAVQQKILKVNINIYYFFLRMLALVSYDQYVF